MIERMSGANSFNIYKFSEVLGLRIMEMVISKRDDFVVDELFYLSQCIDFTTGLIYSVLGFQILPEQGSFAVTGDEIIVFVVILK